MPGRAPLERADTFESMLSAQDDLLIADLPRRRRAASPVLEGGRESGRLLTLGFRRYVHTVLSVGEPTPATDLEALLALAESIMGLRRAPATDAALGRVYGLAARRLAAVVRQTGRSAVAHPALLARAIVVARSVQRAGASRSTERRQALALAAA